MFVAAFLNIVKFTIIFCASTISLIKVYSASVSQAKQLPAFLPNLTRPALCTASDAWPGRALTMHTVHDVHRATKPSSALSLSL